MEFAWLSILSPHPFVSEQRHNFVPIKPGRVQRLHRVARNRKATWIFAFCNTGEDFEFQEREILTFIEDDFVKTVCRKKFSKFLNRTVAANIGLNTAIIQIQHHRPIGSVFLRSFFDAVRNSRHDVWH